MRVWLELGPCLGRAAVDCEPGEAVHAVKARLLRLHGAGLGSDQLALFCGGAVAADAGTVARAGWSDGCTVEGRLRLRGGGGDGGATGAESRASYLEMYAGKKPQKVNPLEEQRAKWTCCRLSGEPLRAPVVADELGSLFNKEALVQALLAKSLPPPLQHITSLKGLLTLQLEPAGQGEAGAVSVDKAGPGNDARFCCPVTAQPLNGRYRFFALRRGGRVVSEKALKEARPAVEELAGGPWAEEDLLPLNGSMEQVEALYAKMLARLSAQRAKKAAKASGAPKALANGHAKGGDTAGPAPAPAPASAPAPGPEHGSSGEAAAGAGRGPAAEAAAATVQGEARAKLPAGRALPEKRRNGALGRRESQEAAKRSRQGGSGDANDYRPQVASKEVWSSIFLSSKPQAEETYSCRSLSSRGWM